MTRAVRCSACDAGEMPIKQRLDDLDRWAASPRSGGRVAASAVTLFATALLVLALVAGVPVAALIFPTIGFIVTMVMAYRRNRRASH